MSYEFISGDLTEELTKKYLETNFVSIDTDTMGLNIKRDRLCLVQLCNDSGLVTLLKITDKNTPNLKKVLENPNNTKIFHYARFDIAILKSYLGIKVANIYCTKIASKLVRTYTEKHGLKNLVFELLGIELDKSSQTTDWGKTEELDKKQLEYAAHDVIYLIKLREILEGMLKREGRTELAHNCMTFLPTLTNLELQDWNENIFSH